MALGAVDPRLGENLGLVNTLGLALFVYTLGLSSGSTLIRTFRRKLPVMAGSVVVLVMIGAGSVMLGHLLGISAPFQGGLFAGIGSSTPALASATDAAGGGTEPAVGYALSYPLAIVLGIIAVHVEMSRPRVTPTRGVHGGFDRSHRGGRAADRPGRGSRCGRGVGAVLVLAARGEGEGRRR